MDKFLRNYRLTVETISGDFIVVQPPFTIEFDVRRNILSSANFSTIRIYNLNEANRNRVLKDQFNYADLRSIVLRAGYGEVQNFPIVFAGQITQCWSVREGTNFITCIEAFDGGFAFVNARFDQQFPSGTENQTIIDSMVGSLSAYGVAGGAIGEYDGEISRGNSYSGATCDLLSDITKGGFFIDNNRANCLGNSEVIDNPAITLINSKSGLLGTPIREQTFLRFEIIFEPNLIIGQQVKIDSSTGANFNGYYKVVSLDHKGMISSAVCGSATTEVGVFYGTQALEPVSVE